MSSGINTTALYSESRSFVELIGQASDDDAKLKDVFRKLNALFEAYAESKKVDVSRLRLLDVCNGEGAVCADLIQFVTKYPLSDVSRPSYFTNVRRLVKAAVGQVIRGGAVDDEQPPPCPDELPAYMHEMLPFVPREGGYGFGRWSDEEARQKLPYSKVGLYFLASCLKVHADLQLTSLQALLVDNASSLFSAVQEITLPRHYSSTYRLVFSIRKQVGVSPPERVYVRVKPDDWLEPFRSEFNNFRFLAGTFMTREPDEEVKKDSLLKAQAARYDVDLYQYRPATITGAETQLSILYGIIRPVIQDMGLTRFSVENLLELTEVAADTPKGVRLINKFVEAYRERECARSDDYKREGYDSGSFACAVDAVIYVAAFNGHWAALKRFGEAYNDVRLDDDSIDRRRQRKKDVFTIEWLDGQIGKLKVEFDRIVKERTFVRDETAPVEVWTWELNTALFFISLVVLRYLGYRQKALRKCGLGINILLKSGEIIEIIYRRDDAKNKKGLKVTLGKKNRRGEWAIVYQALTAYLNIIHPYLNGLASSCGSVESLEGQVFLALDRNHQVVRFEAESNGDFYAWFRCWGRNLLKFPPGTKGLILNPHFLRGLWMDWLHEMGVSDEDISIMSGITVGVINGRYKNKEAVRDATPAMVRLDKRRLEEKQAELDQEMDLKERERAHKTELSRRDKKEAALIRQNESLIKQAEGLMQELAAVRAEKDLLLKKVVSES